MRHTLVAVLGSLTLGMLAAVGARADDGAEVRKELEAFRGTWTFERVEAEGKEVPIEPFAGMTVTFEGDRYTVKNGDEVVQVATQKVDPSKSPKTLDATVVEGPNKGAVILGIYEFDGDRLRVRFDPEGKARPKAFATAAGSPTTLVVHRRAAK